MVDEMGALTLLGESADWLKDAEGTSIRDRRVAALEAYRSAWAESANETRHEALRQSFARLLEALRHNHLYPDAALLDRGTDGTVVFLPSPDSLRKDFERLHDFLVVNKFGIAEVHLLYIAFVLLRTYYQAKPAAYDRILEQALGDVLMLRVPIYRADNLAPFSSELKARYHAVRILGGMRKLGLLEEGPVGKLTPEDHAEVVALLSDELRPAATEYIQRPHRFAFVILDTASALEAFARAHAAAHAPLDERTPQELFSRLRRRLRKLSTRQEVGPVLRDRLLNLGVAASVRTMAHVDAELAQKIYGFLRTGKNNPRVRHTRMFQFLPNSAERLRFLNFLYTHGKHNPVYYIEKFQRHFPDEKVRFVRREIGFILEPTKK